MRALKRIELWLEGLPSAVFFLGLAAICVAVNWVLVPVGLWIHNSDLMLYPLAADHFLKGEWSPFPFRQGYGGTWMTFVRASWVGLYSLFSDSDAGHVTAHMIFSYLFVPFLIAVAIYYATRGFASRSAAAWTGFLAAVGFQSWVHLSGCEYYMGFLALTALILAMKSRADNPLMEMRPRTLLGAGVLLGVSVSNWRASLIYVVVFIVPWSRLLDGAKRFFAPEGRLERLAFGTILFLVMFYVHLEFTRGELGEWMGRRVRLHAHNNLQIAAVLSGLYLWKIYRPSRRWWGRAGLLGAGLFVGLLPEVIYCWVLGSRPLNWLSATLSQALQILPQVPRAISDLLLGWPELNRYSGLLHNFPLILFLVASWALIRESLRRPILLPLLAGGVLSIAAFCRIYMTGPAVSRYLMPLFPIFLIAVGVLWDRWKSSRLGWAFVALALGTSAYQVVQNRAFAAWIRQENKVEQIWEVAREFEAQGVRAVISDEYYYHAAQYMFVSRERVLYSPSWGVQNPPKILEAAKTESKVGIVLTGIETPDSSGRVRLHGREFQLRPLRSVGDARLYIGEAVK